MSAGAVTKSVMATSRTRANRSTPTQDASVTNPIGRPCATTTAAPCARLWISAVAADTESSGDSTTGVSTTRSRLLTNSTLSCTAAIGRSCGSTTRPPRRATVSAIRRPATAVMLATTTGMVVPEPSRVDRSTSKRESTSERVGTMNTSS
ncbi:hypothetical protein C1Y40_04310 [Mycobacterium talmoniae]|uniref:Uncharacterized protein n=1 Tax=Mycobacterium talmoniae TaxID=1858794 RepID=A0A2S8BFW6_9MYCO|nr:hypothetical protein C1Y40_04310 [Mycobacterium talmoniae]